MRAIIISFLVAVVCTQFQGPAAADAVSDCRLAPPDARIDACTQVIAAEKPGSPRAASAYNIRGWGYNDKGDYDRAIVDLNEAIRINPRNEVFYLNRAYSHFRRTDYGLARSDLEKAMEIKPTYAAAYTLRGRIWAIQQQWDRAIADHTEAIKRSPDYLEAYGNRANALYSKRKFDEALTDYRKVVELPAKTPRDRSHLETAKGRIVRLEAAANARSRGATPGSGANPQASAAATAIGDRRRVALVIGNSNYANVVALANPRHDAAAFAELLRRTKFTEVIELQDAGQAAMTEALKTFGDKAVGADWAVVFFAGHGIEINGTSYLVPVDAKLQRDSHVMEEAVSLDRVQAKVDGATKLGLVILDACRNNPFAAKMVRAGGATRSVGAASHGLAPVEPEGNVLIAYSAKHGTVAEDGTGRNSPFTEALLVRAEEPNLDIGLLFRKVRDDVRAKTQRRQDPFVYGSLGGEQVILKPVAQR